MAKASKIAAAQAHSLSDLMLLVTALCEKQGLDVEKLLTPEEPQTRDQMKAYAKPQEAALPEPQATSAKSKRAAKVYEE